jgi:hypothetical protein
MGARVLRFVGELPPAKEGEGQTAILFANAFAVIAARALLPCPADHLLDA